MRSIRNSTRPQVTPVAAAAASGGGGYAATITIAASDARAESKARADVVCDGTDDDREITEALDVCTGLALAHFGSPGGRVLLSEGRFHIGNLGIYSNQHGVFGGGAVLEGQGMDATLLDHVASVANSQPLAVYGDHFSMRNLTMRGTDTTSGGYGVYLSSDHVVIDGVRFVDLGTQGFGMLNITTDYAEVRACQFIRVYDDGGAQISCGGFATRVTDCYFEEALYQAILVGGGSIVANNFLLNPQFVAGGAGHAIEVGLESVVVGNYVDGPGSTISAGVGSEVVGNVVL